MSHSQKALSIALSPVSRLVENRPENVYNEGLERLFRRRLMKILSPLQNEFLDVLEEQGVVEPFGVERAAIIENISRMNAAELRQNIRVFKDTSN
jgi:hypothetical protein